MVNNAIFLHHENQNHVFAIPNLNQTAAGFLHHIITRSQTARSILRKLSSLDIVGPRPSSVNQIQRSRNWGGRKPRISCGPSDVAVNIIWIAVGQILGAYVKVHIARTRSTTAAPPIFIRKNHGVLSKFLFNQSNETTNSEISDRRMCPHISLYVEMCIHILHLCVHMYE